MSEPEVDVPNSRTRAPARALHVFLIGCAVLLASILVVPAEVKDFVYLLLAVWAIGCVLVHLRTLPTPVRWPVLVIVGAGAGFMVSGIVRSLDSASKGVEYAFPSVADAFSLVAYGLFITAILMVVRGRNPHLRLDSILDAVVGGLAAAVLNWLVALTYFETLGTSTAARVVTIFYSVVSLVAFAAAILALVTGSRPTASNRLLAAALIMTVMGDALANIMGSGALSPVFITYFGAAYVTTAAAGLLHPTVRSLLDPPEGSDLGRRLSNRRIAVLAFALVAPPMLLLFQVLRGGSTLELLFPAVCIVLLSPIVLLRLGRLVKQNEELASQEATLRLVGERLVAAQSERDVTMSVKGGLEQLFGSSLVDSGFVLTPFTVRSIGWAPELTPALRAVAAELEQVEEPVTGEFHRLESVGVPALWHAGLVVVQREVRGIVIAATTHEVSESQRNSLEALCRQAAIALRAVERTEQEVRERSEQRFGSLIENSSDIVAVLDETNHLTFVSPVSERLLGRRSGPGHVHELESLVDPDHVGAVQSLIDEARFSGRSTREVRLGHTDGTNHWFEVIASDHVTDPNIGGLLLNARAIDDRKEAEERLVLSEARFKALVQNSSDLLVVADEQGDLTWVSPSAERIVGEPVADLLGRHLGSVFRGSEIDWYSSLRAAGSEEVTSPIEIGFTDVEGKWVTLEAVVTDLRSEPAVAGFVLNARDVTERQSMLVKLRHQATHDSLTGLANRVLVVEQLDDMLAHNPGNSSVAAICIDIDNFRDINDSLGQAAGDEVLRGVADRLRSTLDFGDQAARIGADEFVVILERAHGEEIVFELAGRMLERIAEPFRIGERRLTLSAAAGIAVDHDRAAVGEGLLRNAITAMHQAKRSEHSSVVRFEHEMRTASSERLELREDLARAIGTEQLVVLYQPIVSIENGAILGAEALVRWDHPERGRLSPAMFVPIAEDSGLIGALDAQVRRRACADLAEWRVEIPSARNLYVSTNVSVKELQSAELMPSVLRDLAETGLPAEKLVIEMTESNLLEDSDLVRDRMTALRSHGIRIAVDDFGTGYSSLGYIHSFDFDMLKIDRSFIVGLSRTTNQRIVSAVLDLAADLRAGVVAEGIETPAQEQQLLDLGCVTGQGFLYSRPAPAAQFRRLLTASEKLHAG